MAAPVQVKPGTETETSARKSAGVAIGEAERVELDGRKSFFDLRKNWSCWIIAWISILILFNIALTGLVGYGVLDFANYQWFITAITVETFLQIVGMGYIAVRFLFSNGTSK